MEQQPPFDDKNLNNNESNFNLHNIFSPIQSDEDNFFISDFDNDPFGIENFNNYFAPILNINEEEKNKSLNKKKLKYDRTKLFRQSKQIRKRRPKEKIELSWNGNAFLNGMKYILKHDKTAKIRKELVIKYHKMACEKNHLIRKIPRNEYRSINRYFNTFADQSYLILNTIQELINDGKINYEEEYRILVSK